MRDYSIHNSNICYVSRYFNINGPLIKAERGYYCFGHTLEKLNYDETDTISYVLYLNNGDTAYKHKVLMDVAGIDDYLYHLRSLYPDHFLDYNIIDKDFGFVCEEEFSNWEIDNCLRVEVVIKGNRTAHTWILTNIRSLYEMPHNYILLEALRIKNNSKYEELRNETILNLHQVIFTTLNPPYYDDQSLFYPKRWLVNNPSYILDCINGEHSDYILDIYPGILFNRQIDNVLRIDKINWINENGNQVEIKSKHEEFWTKVSNEELDRRENAYLENWKKQNPYLHFDKEEVDKIFKSKIR